MLTAVNAAFTFVNERSISAAVTSVNRINAAFTNVNATALNVRGVVSKHLRCVAPTMPDRTFDGTPY